MHRILGYQSKDLGLGLFVEDNRFSVIHVLCFIRSDNSEYITKSHTHVKKSGISVTSTRHHILQFE